jgi:hypothetical protein
MMHCCGAVLTSALALRAREVPSAASHRYYSTVLQDLRLDELCSDVCNISAVFSTPLYSHGRGI